MQIVLFIYFFGASPPSPSLLKTPRHQYLCLEVGEIWFATDNPFLLLK